MALGILWHILLLLRIILLVLAGLLRRLSVFVLRTAIALGIQLFRIVLEEQVKLVDALLNVI